MGNQGSVLSEEKLQELEKSTNFSVKEITKILKRYGALDGSPNGEEGIPITKFLNIPEVVGNPIMPCVFAKFSDPQGGNLGPEPFLLLFSMLHPDEPMDKKQKFAFDMLDVDSQEQLGFEELFSLYKLLYSPALSDQKISHLTAQVLFRDDLATPGYINFDEFCQLVPVSEIKSRLTVQLQLS
ncbi:PPP3R1 [Branchiostoma lanceolatum]|uniref:PPP3R1 protein n=1 Tax=Branchiostoma lanceolatum TaxID=7740 RepID=A0A8J9WC56_BRALA|nr:PPP3R1 [Branchiostoma lanceolatum]